MKAITTIPDINAAKCFKDSILSSSRSKSGNTVTNAMWRNPPAVKGTIQEVFASRIQIEKNYDDAFRLHPHIAGYAEGTQFKD